MNNYSSSYSNICRKNELIKIPGLWDFKSGIAMCNVLRGQINVITDYLNQELVLSLMNETNCNCGNVFKKLPLSTITAHYNYIYLIFS